MAKSKLNRCASTQRRNDTRIAVYNTVCIFCNHNHRPCSGICTVRLPQGANIIGLHLSKRDIAWSVRVWNRYNVNATNTAGPMFCVSRSRELNSVQYVHITYTCTFPVQKHMPVFSLDKYKSGCQIFPRVHESQWLKFVIAAAYARI